MPEREIVELTVRALETARAAWESANADLPPNPMTRTAAIPAVGILAAAILDEGLAPEQARELAERAVAIARQAWDRTHPDPPGNPIATTAARSVIGIVAAGVLKRLLRTASSATPDHHPIGSPNSSAEY